ncbi:MAG: CdaR family protein [Bacilli bacterium]|nr:CdaR family protein [Bacilli bacterium]
MKLIKSIFFAIAAVFGNIYKLIDRLIIVPITKIMIFFSDRFGTRTDKLEKMLTRKNTLVFISLILAVCIFLYVDSESTIIINDSAEVLYDQKVKVTYNSNAYVIEGLPEEVDVTLIGRRVDLYLAKQLSKGSVTADLTKLKEGSHTISLDYDCSITSVNYKLDPSVVNINIYPKVSETRTASIDIINKNKLDKKLSVGDVTLNENEVVIKGAEHTLKKVSIVKALVDINKLVDPTIGVSELDDIKLVAYDSDGNVVKNIETEPNNLSAKITIESPRKETPIKVIPTGDLEFGKAIDNITTNIGKVTVYGDQDILDKLEYLPVEVDVTGLNESKTYDVILSRPSGIKEISNTNIKVTVTLGAEITKEINDVFIETVNLDPNYKAVAIGENSSKTSIIVKGTKNVIEAIDSTMVTAQVDLKGYSEGDYEVTVKATGDDNKATYSAKTTKIKIRITKK